MTDFYCLFCFEMLATRREFLKEQEAADGEGNKAGKEEVLPILGHFRDEPIVEDVWLVDDDSEEEKGQKEAEDKDGRSLPDLGLLPLSSKLVEFDCGIFFLLCC